MGELAHCVGVAGRKYIDIAKQSEFLNEIKKESKKIDSKQIWNECIAVATAMQRRTPTPDLDSSPPENSAGEEQKKSNRD
jgi:hypothetical protein